MSEMQHDIFHIDELWRRLSPDDGALAELQKEAQATAIKAWQERHGLNATRATGQVDTSA